LALTQAVPGAGIGWIGPDLLAVGAGPTTTTTGVAVSRAVAAHQALARSRHRPLNSGVVADPPWPQCAVPAGSPASFLPGPAGSARPGQRIRNNHCMSVLR